LLAGLVRAVAVVGCGHRPPVPFAGDQHRVGALGPYGAHPPPGRAVGPRRPRRSRDRPDALVGEDLAGHAGELGVAVADEEERHEAIGPAGSMMRLRACRAVHAPSGWVVTPGRCPRRVGACMTNSTYRRVRKIVSTWNKSQASRPPARVRRHARQQVPRWRGAGRWRRAPPDRSHGCRAEVVTEPGEFPVHPAVSPGPVLLREPQHQVPDLPAGPRAPRPVRVDP
jgi:hypothetical protein